MLVFVRSCSSINNKIISLKKSFHHSHLGAPQKEKKSGALGTCRVCPLVKTALIIGNKSVPIQLEGLEGDLLGCPCWPANIRHTVGPRDLQSWRGRFPWVPWGGRAYVRWSHSTRQTTQTTTSTMNPVPSITAAIASASYDLRVAYTLPRPTLAPRLQRPDLQNILRFIVRLS